MTKLDVLRIAEQDAADALTAAVQALKDAERAKRKAFEKWLQANRELTAAQARAELRKGVRA